MAWPLTLSIANKQVRVSYAYIYMDACVRVCVRRQHIYSWDVEERMFIFIQTDIFQEREVCFFDRLICVGTTYADFSVLVVATFRVFSPFSNKLHDTYFLLRLINGYMNIRWKNDCNEISFDVIFSEPKDELNGSRTFSQRCRSERERESKRKAHWYFTPRQWTIKRFSYSNCIKMAKRIRAETMFGLMLFAPLFNCLPFLHDLNEIIIILMAFLCWEKCWADFFTKLSQLWATLALTMQFTRGIDEKWYGTCFQMNYGSNKLKIADEKNTSK